MSAAALPRRRCGVRHSWPKYFTPLLLAGLRDPREVVAVLHRRRCPVCGAEQYSGKQLWPWWQRPIAAATVRLHNLLTGQPIPDGLIGSDVLWRPPTDAGSR